MMQRMYANCMPMGQPMQQSPPVGNGPCFWQMVPMECNMQGLMQQVMSMPPDAQQFLAAQMQGAAAMSQTQLQTQLQTPSNQEARAVHANSMADNAAKHQRGNKRPDTRAARAQKMFAKHAADVSMARKTDQLSREEDDESFVDQDFLDSGNLPCTVPPEQRTTVMLRNLPNNYSRAMLLDLIDSEGFAKLYDFIYLPIDFKSRASLGYAFVNFSSPSVAQKFRSRFHGFSNWILPSRKVCIVNWSGPHQGLEAHIERYRNSPVMHEAVPDAYKPAIFQDGNRAHFPGPTRKLRAPRIRHFRTGMTSDLRVGNQTAMHSSHDASGMPMRQMEGADLSGDEQYWM